MMINSSYDFIFKFVIVGDSSVGKSSFLNRFTDNVYTDSLLPTIGVDFKIRSVEIQDKSVRISIWDTAGQERFKNIVKNYYRGAHGIIFLYDITDRNSFENVSKWISEVREIADKDVQMMLVGNKCDQIDQRTVETEQGIEFAEKMNMSFFETSAQTSINVDKSFFALAEELVSMQSIINQKKQKETLKIQNVEISQESKQVSCC